MKSEKVEKLLNYAVQKSLGAEPQRDSKYSIIDCAGNQFLNGEYDSVKELEGELLLMSWVIKQRERLNGRN